MDTTKSQHSGFLSALSTLSIPSICAHRIECAPFPVFLL